MISRRPPKNRQERRPVDRRSMSEAVSAGFDGELDATEAAALRKRLAEDPSLARERSRIETISRFLRPAVEPDPGFVVRFRERRRSVSAIPRWTWRQLGVRLAAATAVLVVAAGLSLRLASDAGEGAAEVVAPAEALVALEDEILGADPDPGAPPTTSEGREPVLLIALGSPVLGGFGPGR